MADPVEQVPRDELDEELEEGWQRLTDEPDVRGVEAHRWPSDEWPWQVTVWVAEFLREDPLEGELRAGMATALAAVSGVTAVAEEDREIWTVAGKPSGAELVAAAARVVDGLADRARVEIEGG